jgi:putative heme-binding domain-containing protein
MRWAFFLVAGFGALAQTRESNPFTSERDIAEGRKLYSYYCVFCHGMDGVSGRGAQLASNYRKHGSSDREMFRTIADGVPGTEMSGHWIEEDEIWKILSFVRVLEKSAAGRTMGCTPGAGDAARGAALFAGKGGCKACHRVDSRLGPDLSAIGATHPREHLRESLVDPGKEMSRKFRTVRVRTTAGAAVRGILLNQDEYTVHLLDASERTQSFRRSALAAVEFPTESLMPSYASTLSAGEVDDVVAHLCTLRGGSK